MLKDKLFYKTLLSLALPIALQNLISSSLNMVDTMMIGKLGDTEIAAVGLANQYFFFFILIMFGINSGSSIFIAQFWGKRDVKNIRRILGINLLTGGIIAVIFSILAFFYPQYILKFFIKDKDVIFLGSKYLRIVCLSYILNCISFAFGTASRSTGHAKLPMYASIIALICNTLLNYLFIFGNFYFPKMGVQGAALATLISRIIEITIILYAVYKQKGVLAAQINELLDLNFNFIGKFFKTTTPVILNEALWSLGMVMYSVAYAKIGKSEVAAVQVANTIQNVFMVISMGLANACAVMIGNKIGEKKEEIGILYAKRFSFLAPLSGVIMGFFLFLSSPLILSFFSLSDKASYETRKIILIMSIFMAIKMFNATMIVGILRSGGDTKFSLFLEVGTVWGVGVPLAFLGALVLKLPVYWVVFLVFLEEIVKAAIGIPRIVSKKWIRNIVDNM